MSDKFLVPKSPKNHPEFIKMWRLLYLPVVNRENFKEHHLSQLMILCDLYVELEKLNDLIELLGYTYDAVGGRGAGEIIRIRPEVNQINRCRSEIRNYSKLLGLLLVETENGNTKEEEEWE